jgi:hypothetical protein
MIVRTTFFEAEHIGCEILKEACRKQFEIVGDNTYLFISPGFLQNSLEELKKEHLLK